MAKASRILFARVGQMVFYAGPQTGDEKPTGGGEHNREKLGHESFNFLKFGGMLYGFIQRPPDFRKIDPGVPESATRIDGVTIVFVAPYPNGQRVVGWYKDAVIYRDHKIYPLQVKKCIDRSLAKAGRTKEAAGFKHYWVEASIDKAVLLPTRVRMSRPPIPRREKGGFGQWNISYIYKPVGVRKNEEWIDQVLSSVVDYKGRNLLVEPEAEISVPEAITEQQERAAGFQSNPAIRRAIESYAMKKAETKLRRRGYRDFDNTANRESYDYTCKKDGKSFFVEVKGTQTAGNAVILTKNEVAHAQKHSDRSIIVIVHTVEVHDGNPPLVSKGQVDVYESWRLSSNDLTALHYLWTVPRPHKYHKNTLVHTGLSNH
jgi:hypothetical protein